MLTLSTDFLDFNSAHALREQLRDLRSRAFDLVGQDLTGAKTSESDFTGLESILPEEIPAVNQQVNSYEDLGRELARKHFYSPREKSSLTGGLLIQGNSVDYGLEPVAMKNDESAYFVKSLMNSFFELLDLRKNISDTKEGETIKTSLDKYLRRMIQLGKGAFKSLLPEDFQI